MAGMPGVTPNMVTQPEPSGPAVPSEYAPSVSYGENTPNPVAEEVSSPGAQAAPTAAGGEASPMPAKPGAANFSLGSPVQPDKSGPGVDLNGANISTDPSNLPPAHKRAHALGTFFSALAGPQGTPGSFFRNILAGALTGAAAGAEAKMGGGVGSFAVGAGAQMKEQQRQQQQEFENQMKTKQEAREQTAFETEQQVRKGTIAMNNMQTLRLNNLIQGESAERHENEAKAGRAQIQSYVEAHIDPEAKDIPVSQKTRFIKDHPGSGSWDWEHTGVKYGTDAEGNSTYEETLTAYDPKKPVPISQATYNQWKADGVFDRYPEWADQAKPGKVIKAIDFVNLKGKAEGVRADNLTRNKEDLGIKEMQAHIDEARAAIEAHHATAQHERAETANITEEKTAWDHLQAAGNDPTKSPMTARDRSVLARASRATMQDTLTAMKVAQKDADSGDPEAKATLKSLWATYNTLQKLSNFGGQDDPNKAAADLIKNSTKGPLDPATVKEGLVKNGVSEADQAQVFGYLGLMMPTAPITAAQQVKNDTLAGSPAVAKYIGAADQSEALDLLEKDRKDKSKKMSNETYSQLAGIISEHYGKTREAQQKEKEQEEAQQAEIDRRRRIAQIPKGQENFYSSQGYYNMPVIP